MKNDRKPVYSKDQQTRVVSVANGLWQLQGCTNAKGTRVFDPWFKRGAPTEFNEALKNLGR